MKRVFNYAPARFRRPPTRKRAVRERVLRNRSRRLWRTFSRQQWNECPWFFLGKRSR